MRFCCWPAGTTLACSPFYAGESSGFLVQQACLITVGTAQPSACPTLPAAPSSCSSPADPQMMAPCLLLLRPGTPLLGSAPSCSLGKPSLTLRAIPCPSLGFLQTRQFSQPCHLLPSLAPSRLGAPAERCSIARGVGHLGVRDMYY